MRLTSYFISQGEPNPDRALTQRQAEILQLVAEGRSTGEIAEQLHLSTVTVRNHIARSLAALGVHTRVHAIVRAARLGVIHLPKGESYGRNV